MGEVILWLFKNLTNADFSLIKQIINNSTINIKNFYNR